MPKLSFVQLPLNSKHYKLVALFLLSPLFFFGQSLTGLWVGALSNDSTTVRKDQSFEIALTEYKGKVYGYSRSEFIVDDVLYYIVKRVKGTIEGDVCEVTDDDIVAYNFPKKLDKNIKVTSTFRRDKGDSVWHLDGKWKTNATKKYYSVSGNVALEAEPDLTASKIFPHLEELKLADDVAFYKERKEGQPIVRIAKPEKIKPEYASKAEQLSTEKDIAAATNNPVVQKATPGIVTSKPVFVNANGEAPGTVAENKKPETLIAKDPVIAANKTNKNTTSAITEKKENEQVVAMQKPIVVNRPEPVNAIAKNNSTAIVTNTTEGTNKTAEEKKDVKTEPVAKTTIKQEAAIIKQQSVPFKQADVVTTETKNNSVAINKTTTPAVTTEEKKITKADPLAKTTVKQDAPANKTQQPTTTKQPEPVNTIAKNTTATTIVTPEKKDVFIAPVIPDTKKTDADITLKAALIAGRKSEFTQVVNFKSDSLQISLYDNGEIDGDTVSVFMNGEVLLSKQGLKSSAIRKTIYLTPGENDAFTLVMFAESLGKYPPNTGLLVIRDGDDVYNLRFSSDFQKNAGIIFKKKN